MNDPYLGHLHAEYVANELLGYHERITTCQIAEIPQSTTAMLTDPSLERAHEHFLKLATEMGYSVQKIAPEKKKVA